ncbi:MAG: hypothetical protein EOS10_33585 [Mesorhizobium sp.]|nr:MAG: hypothetical protein EOS10_33585 [Mesorhizobium sp.]
MPKFSRATDGGRELSHSFRACFARVISVPHPLRRCFATPTESQAADITQLLFEADTKESTEFAVKGSQERRRRRLDTSIYRRSEAKRRKNGRGSLNRACSAQVSPLYWADGWLISAMWRRFLPPHRHTDALLPSCQT